MANPPEILAGRMLKAVAAKLGPSFASSLPPALLAGADLSAVTEVQASFNSLSDLAGLEKFPNVETLILDNNALTSLASMPASMKKLKTLWVNHNGIADLQSALDIIKVRCPSLTYLSLLCNPCCPDPFSGTGVDAEYNRFRIYVKYVLPGLTMLDSSAITDDEAKQARERGQFYAGVARPAAPPPAPTAAAAAAAPPAVEGEDKVNLFEKVEKKQGAKAEGLFAQQRHFYSGKTSEGNRFIGNDML